MEAKPKTQQIDQLLKHYFRPDGAGCVLYVAQQGQCLYHGAAGLAQINPAQPLSVDTPIDLASCSKMMTAAAILRMTEMDLLSLTDPIHNWFDLPSTASERPITIMDCLCHTSAIEDYLSQGMYTEPGLLQPEAIMDFIQDAIQTAEPGLMHTYSNSNYVILAHIVEQVSGKTYQQFLDQHLFHPLGIQVTYHPDADGLYLASGAFSKWEVSEYMLVDVLGDGSIGMTAADAATWMQALIQGKIISPESVALMTQAQTLDDGTTFKYGLGMVVENDGDAQWIGHNGSWTSSTTLMGYYPQDELLMVILSNEFMAPVERLGVQLHQLIKAN